MSDPADLLGRRVTVRHRIDGRGPSTTDVVGRVLEADRRSLVVERRDGSVVRVDVGTVVALKVVPDRPARSRPAAAITPEELTRVTSRGWPAPDSEPLGDWELRAAGAFTGRANSVAVHGDPGTSLEAALEVVLAFYARRDLPPQAQVVVGSTWDSRFTAAGWTRKEGYRGGALVQVADVPTAPDPDPRVDIGPAAGDSWLARYERVEDVEAARAVLEGPRTVGFAELASPGGETLGVGRVVVTGEWAGLAAVETRPDLRRQGLGRAIVRSCLAWAVQRGATRAYLQTMTDNTAALGLYAPFGFTTHHEYAYLVPPTAH
ncbi:GNAT family N-acetyltransferase [Aeromicrobium sp. CF4.19]|uniref:GNAT family N-acetyltransferase n=1 Tax=Aeromicrobium sp. CF4.19 TaxID=3373082 RepID=UPI003EE55A6F